MAVTVLAGDFCIVCGKPIDGTYYLVTDQVLGTNRMVCANCIKAPRCFICGLPVTADGIALSDGRHLCARDGKTAVIRADDARRIADEVIDSLNKLFSRFTSFPTNVDVTVLDRIDLDKMFQPGGYEFESPNVLGCISVKTNAGARHYSMRLLSGLPLAELKATAAHEYTHAWVGENVPAERRDRLSPDAEEGFCELVAYLLMNSQHEEVQKDFILKNHYTRGQVGVFIATEQHYGFNEILDWMRQGESPALEEAHLEKIRNINTVSTPVPASGTGGPASPPNLADAGFISATRSAPAPGGIKLQGILWGNPPAAIINGQMVHANDNFKLKIGPKEMDLRCIEIRKNSVRIENTNTREQGELQF
jgi:hypothetical protein